MVLALFINAYIHKANFIIAWAIHPQILMASLYICHSERSRGISRPINGCPGSFAVFKPKGRDYWLLSIHIWYKVKVSQAFTDHWATDYLFAWHIICKYALTGSYLVKS